MTNIPSHVPEERVCPFDPTVDHHKAGDPFSAYERFRGRGISWSPDLGGFWVMPDAEHVREVFQHPELFSSAQTSLPAQDAWPRKLIPVEIDPPEHNPYRHLLAGPFSPKVVAEMEEPVRDICIELIEGFVGDGSCEFITRFARRYPTGVFIEHLMGFPREMTDEFVTLAYTLLHGDTPEIKREHGAKLVDFLTGVIDERSAAPDGDDLVCTLLRSSIDDRHLTKEEVLDTCFLLYIAGLDTVTSMLSFSFRFLADNPDHRRQIVGQPGVVPGAVEELLRYYSFVSPTRTATADFEFHGVQMKKGDRVHLPAVLASRDPHEFEQADEVHFDRRANRHLAFGAGPHRCLGSHLARRELAVALKEWHARIPDYEIPPGTEIPFHGGTMVSLTELPLRW